MRRFAPLLALILLANLSLPILVPHQAMAWSTAPTANTPVCTDEALQAQHAVASDGSGGAIIVWQDWRNHGTSSFDIYAQKVASSGAPQWTADGIPVCTARSVQEDPAMCGDGCGGGIIAWVDARRPGLDIYAQRVDTTGTPRWTADGVPVCTTPGDFPAVASDNSGGAIIVWTGGGHIYAQRMSPSGIPQWAAGGVAICEAVGGQGSIAVMSDGSGGAIVAWVDFRGPSLLGTYFGDVYAQKIDSAGVPQWAADGVAICTVPYGQEQPAIVSDGSGGAIITWVDGRCSNRSEYYYTTDVYAQRIDSAGVPQWAADGVAICTASYRQGRPGMVSDNAGGAIITWADKRFSNPNDYPNRINVYAQRIDPAGVSLWVADGVAICTEHGNTPVIVSDGSGGAVVSWRDSRHRIQAGDNYYYDPAIYDSDVDFKEDDDIYAQRVDASGEPQWAPNGMAVSTAENLQITPRIVSDNSGGGIIVWNDYRGGEDSDIYAQRVDAWGALGSPTGDTKVPFWVWLLAAGGVIAVAAVGLIVWRRMAGAKRVSTGAKQ